MSSDLEICRAATLRPITDIAVGLGVPLDAVEPYGRYKAKIDITRLDHSTNQQNGHAGASNLVLVTGMSPTPAGEGKTTTAIGLVDALRVCLGIKSMVCLREPSLGPCFGMKGGATGGGYAQVGPMEDINLHLTGDLHAIAAANNLLAAMVDNHIHFGNAMNLDRSRVTWKRTMDMNDRALRKVTTCKGGYPGAVEMETGFDITAASEVMAVVCLSESLVDLQKRLARIVVGYTPEGKPVTAGDINADGAMAVLLKDAMSPNLLQTLEGTPAFIHGGPFANIAHGCNSVMATRTACQLADIAVTEAGFGADLGAEKFVDIKCRQSGLTPACVVLVASIRALRFHGGVGKANVGKADLEAVKKGLSNLQRHVENLTKKLGLETIVALNHFTTDTAEELEAVKSAVAPVEVVVCTHWADGSKGAKELAEKVAAMVKAGKSKMQLMYPDEMPLLDKIRTVVKELYVGDVETTPAVNDKLQLLTSQGFGNLPVCIAKTPYSFTDKDDQLGAPEGHTVKISDVKVSAGAGFVVALCGNVMTMPGLPKVPAAVNMRLNEKGEIEGLF